jgi:hypothetical protein
MPEEVKFFGRIGAYGLFIAAVYWFVSYEPAGTVLLGGFGLATGAAFVLLRRGARRPAVTRDGGADRPSDRSIAALAPDGPFGDESGPVPLRSLAPFEVGFGLAVMSLSVAFGIWFAIAGLLPLAIGAADWLGSANRELDLIDSPAHGVDREE